MGFTKRHAEENRQMRQAGDRLTAQGVTDYARLIQELQAQFPQVPPHRIRRAAAEALRRWRGRLRRSEA